MAIINEQVDIVKHYMENMDEYRLENGEWWENLKFTLWKQDNM
jgi:hypothetical protein